VDFLIPLDANETSILHGGCDEEAPASKGIVENHGTFIRVGSDEVTRQFDRLLGGMPNCLFDFALRRLEVDHVRWIALPVAPNMSGFEIPVGARLLALPQAFVISFALLHLGIVGGLLSVENADVLVLPQRLLLRVEEVRRFRLLPDDLVAKPVWVRQDQLGREDALRGEDGSAIWFQNPVIFSPQSEPRRA
jgi:hypothetical protein